MAQEIKQWIYIKGPAAEKRLENLMALAAASPLRNFSAFMNDAVNRLYNLDPDTGERLPGKPPCNCGQHEKAKR